MFFLFKNLHSSHYSFFPKDTWNISFELRVDLDIHMSIGIFLLHLIVASLIEVKGMKQISLGACSWSNV